LFYSANSCIPLVRYAVNLWYCNPASLPSLYHTTSGYIFYTYSARNPACLILGSLTFSGFSPLYKNVMGFNCIIFYNWDSVIYWISCLYALKEVSFKEAHYKLPLISTSKDAAPSLVLFANPLRATIFIEELIIPP